MIAYVSLLMCVIVAYLALMTAWSDVWRKQTWEDDDREERAERRNVLTVLHVKGWALEYTLWTLQC